MVRSSGAVTNHSAIEVSTVEGVNDPFPGRLDHLARPFGRKLVTVRTSEHRDDVECAWAVVGDGRLTICSERAKQLCSKWCVRRRADSSGCSPGACSGRCVVSRGKNQRATCAASQGLQSDVVHLLAREFHLQCQWRPTSSGDISAHPDGAVC